MKKLTAKTKPMKTHEVRLLVSVECPSCKGQLFRKPDRGLFCDAGPSCAFSAAGTVLDDRVPMPELQPEKPEKKKKDHPES